MDPWKVEGVTMTSEELVERSSTWTLACDNAVLNKLKAFSEEVHNNSLAIKQDCESLSEDVTRLQARLSNVTNNFLMISNTQFVENRVEEFEEATVAAEANNKGPEKIKTKQEKEVELIAKMKKAIQLGINSCATSSSAAKERRKPKMPHLIGSSKFFSSQYVGLFDHVPPPIPKDNLSLDGNSVSQLSSSGEVRNVLSELSGQSSTVPTVSKVSSDTPTSSTYFQPPVPYDNDIYAPKTTAYEEPPVIQKPSTTMAQPQFSYPRPTPSRTQVPLPISSDIGPPPLDQSDESDDDFKPRSSGQGRLFLDDDEDEDLFNDRSLFPPKKQADINSLFFGKNSAAVKPSVSVISPPPYNEKNGDDGLGNQEKDESKPAADYRKLDVGVLPGGRSSNPIISNRTTQEAEVTVKENSDSDKVSSPSVKDTHEDYTKSKIPPGAVSVFGKVPPGEFPRFKNNKGNDTSNQQASSKPDTVIQPISDPSKSDRSRSTLTKEVSITDIVRDQEYSTSRQSSLASKVTNNSSQSSLSTEPAKSVLFDSDSDEDLFFSAKKKSSTSTKNNPTSLSSRSSTLFSDQTSSKSLTVPSKVSTAAVKKKSSLFDDSDSGDDLFSSASSSSSKNKQTANFLDQTKDRKQSSDIPNKKPPEVQTKSSVLFDNDSDSDGDLFSSSKVKSKSSVSNNLVKPRKETIPSKSEIRIMDSEESLDIQNSSSSVEHDHHLGMKNHEKDPSNYTGVDGEDNEFKCDKVDGKLSVPIVQELESTKVVGSSEETNPIHGEKTSNTSSSTQDRTSIESKVVSPSKTKNSKLKLQFESIGSESSVKTDEMKAVVEKVRPKKHNSASELIAAIKSRMPPDNTEDKEIEKKPNDDKIKDEKPAKRTISVKALALGLNLNPLAMKPGAKPKKLGSQEKSESSEGSQPTSAAETPSSLLDHEINDNKSSETTNDGSGSPHDFLQVPSPILPVEDQVNDEKEASDGKQDSVKSSETCSNSATDEMDSTGPLLANLVKGRPKGQANRRPPSKKLLKLYANQEQQESVDSSNGTPPVDLTLEQDVPDQIAASEETLKTTTEPEASQKDSVPTIIDLTSDVEPSIIDLTNDDEPRKEFQFQGAEPPPLGDDDSDDDPKTASKSGTIFVDDDDDDDIFNDKSLIAAPESNEVVPESKPTKNTKSIPPPIQASGSSNDLKTNKSGKNKKSSLFIDSDSDDDLFGSSKKTKSALPSSKSSLKNKSTAEKSSQKAKSLFGDDSDDDSDLFKPSKLKSKSKQTEKDSAINKAGEIVDYGSF